jgi:hypothetical protein
MHLVAAGSEVDPQGAQQLGVVVDDQYRGHNDAWAG